MNQMMMKFKASASPLYARGQRQFMGAGCVVRLCAVVLNELRQQDDDPTRKAD
jgi:hypothetical protein